MKWRCIEEPDERQPLPGPKTELAITWTGKDFMVYSREEDGTCGWAFYASVEHGPGQRLTLRRDEGMHRPGLLGVEHEDKKTVYVPAASVKRKKLPVPPFAMTRFGKPQHDPDTGRRQKDRCVVHVVKSVDEVPDPNRRWNTNDALVTARCGYSGWVEPEFFDPTNGAWAVCPECIR